MAQRFLCRENGCFSDNGMALNIAKCGRGAMLKGCRAELEFNHLRLQWVLANAHSTLKLSRMR